MIVVNAINKILAKNSWTVKRLSDEINKTLNFITPERILNILNGAVLTELEDENLLNILIDIQINSF